jgi:hypothetical protein
MTNTYDKDTPFELKVFEEIRCTRCVLERILRCMDEGLFVDYQMEKFGKKQFGTFKPGGGWAEAMMKGGKK